MSEPQRPVNTSKMAYKGRSVNPDNFPTQPFPPVNKVTVVSSYTSFEPYVDVDYTDLVQINQQLMQLRIRIHKVRKELAEAQRQMVKHKQIFDDAKKRTWVSLTGGSDKSREAMAELMNESLFNNYLVSKTVVDELVQLSRDTRTELDTLKEISNNQRRQIELDTHSN